MSQLPHAILYVQKSILFQTKVSPFYLMFWNSISLFVTYLFHSVDIILYSDPIYSFCAIHTFNGKDIKVLFWILAIEPCSHVTAPPAPLHVIRNPWTATFVRNSSVSYKPTEFCQPIFFLFLFIKWTLITDALILFCTIIHEKYNHEKCDLKFILFIQNHWSKSFV